MQEYFHIVRHIVQKLCFKSNEQHVIEIEKDGTITFIAGIILLRKLYMFA